MGRKQWTLEQVPDLQEHCDYIKRFDGAASGDLQSALFHGFPHTPLGSACGSHQLYVLYLAYLCIRVTMRVLKRTGVKIQESMEFAFRWEGATFDETLASEVLAVLNYSNVFLDWWRMKRQKKAFRPDSKVNPYTLMNAAAQAIVRLHDVRKDSWPTASAPLDPKYCHFRELLGRCTTKARRASLISIWVTTRSIHLMDDFMADKPPDSWSPGWLSHIRFMSRDRGLLRETPTTCTRAKDAVLQIQRESQKRGMKWQGLTAILEDKSMLPDWGSFKNQHLSWTTYLTGDLKLDEDASGGLTFEELSIGLRESYRNVHLTHDDFDLLSEHGMHLGPGGEFDSQQFHVSYIP